MVRRGSRESQRQPLDDAGWSSRCGSCGDRDRQRRVVRAQRTHRRCVVRRVAALISGALSGLGVIVLLQQYSVAYPTALLTIIGIVLGIGAQFAVMFVATRYAHAGSPPVALAMTGESGEQPEMADPSTWV